ncbi:hypothetical protein EPUL_005295 [Erysiphe pulchra]|uniref:Uncharacterized protein n=1 Tax=Erysiphe pulchra TaxID=225359 RepID=A0A2S4PKI3_9PEZI|nr:hypothetical protein EPUL_005295 [Erysiphe pulchra]
MYFSNKSFVFPALTVSIDATTTFRLVFTRESDGPVDVFAKTLNDDYTKCIWRESSHIEPSHTELEITNGFLCGNEFFTNEIIQQSLALAQTSVRENSIYPCLYYGNIYPADGGFLMWPITREKKLYKSGKVPVGPFYLILNKERQFVDVVVSGYSNNFLRCTRSRQPPKAPESDPHSEVFEPSSMSGFLCGKTFFGNNILIKSAEIAKNKADRVVTGLLPTEYIGPPYNVPCLIWPLLRDGSLYKGGMKAPYRLVLTSDYKVMSVAILVGDELKACDKRTIYADKKHDTSDYQCFKRLFSHQQLVDAAKIACVKMNAPVTNHFPAGYEGHEFDSEGPYYTYPVRTNGAHRQHLRQDRVVINLNCEVVGALTWVNGLPKRLVKCHRLADGPVPKGFFGPNAKTVHEKFINY